METVICPLSSGAAATDSHRKYFIAMHACKEILITMGRPFSATPAFLSPNCIVNVELSSDPFLDVFEPVLIGLQGIVSIGNQMAYPAPS